MRILFLGTAAAEGFPGIFCNCKNCQAARAAGGRNLRFRSALLINADLLIDFGPDLLASAQKFNLNLSTVTTGLITHAHADHFHIENLLLRRKGFTGDTILPTMNLFGPHDIADALAKEPYSQADLHLAVKTIHAFDTWTDGSYTIQAFRARHALGDLEAVFYSISDGSHSVLYATDTGPFPEDTWQALDRQQFDVIILEETLGHGRYEQHMSFETFIEHAGKMRAQNMLRPGGRFIAHHMSHSANPIHSEVEAILCPHGVEVAYDGMEINL